MTSLWNRPKVKAMSHAAFDRREKRVDRIAQAIWSRLEETRPYSVYRYRPAAEAAINEVFSRFDETPYPDRVAADAQRAVARRLEDLLTDLILAGWSGDEAGEIIKATVAGEVWSPRPEADEAS